MTCPTCSRLRLALYAAATPALPGNWRVPDGAKLRKMDEGSAKFVAVRSEYAKHLADEHDETLVILRPDYRDSAEADELMSEKRERMVKNGSN